LHGSALTHSISSSTGRISSSSPPGVSIRQYGYLHLSFPPTPHTHTLEALYNSWAPSVYSPIQWESFSKQLLRYIVEVFIDKTSAY